MGPINPASQFFDRNQKKKAQNSFSNVKTRFDVFTEAKLSPKSSKPITSPFRIGPRI